MRLLSLIAFTTILASAGCLRIEEEPIMTVSPTAEITAHVKNGKIFATVQINVNPQIINAGNLPIYYEYGGEFAIYNTLTGTVIDLNSFTGGGLSQYYTVSADTASHKRFVIVAEGSISAIADTGGDSDTSNDVTVAYGEFHNERELLVSGLLITTEL